MLDKAINLPQIPDSDLDGGPELIENQDVKDRKATSKDYMRIFNYADKLSWSLNVLSLVSSIAAGVVLPLMTIVFGNAVADFNKFSAGNINAATFQHLILNYVLWYIYLFVAKLVLSYVSTLSICIAAIRTTRNLRQAFLDSLLRKEIWHFDSKDPSSVAVLMMTNGARINKGIADKLAFLVQYVAMFFAAFIVALVRQWKLTLIAMTAIPPIFLTVALLVPIEAAIESRVMRIYSKGASVAQEAISTIRNIHAFCAQSKMVEKFDTLLQQAHIEGNKKSILWGVLFSAEHFFVFSGVALSFWKGYRMFASGEIDGIGPVFTVVFSTLIAASTLSAIAPQFQTFSNAAAAASEIFELMDRLSKLDPLSDDGFKASKCVGDIEISGLKFSYPSRRSIKVLKGLSLSIPAGKTTALVGISGCGKSTIVSLLERWYERESGSIELDGLDITQYNTKWLRSQIGLVQQEPVLFQGTVYQNVANGFTDEQKSLKYEEQLLLVQQACQTSYAHDFISELPKGYNTEVGEAASLLSGGQRQRIAIARSIISNPRILLLDEATSALDPKAEGIVQKALDRVSVNRTTLVIAHKLATVKNADNIAVISDGKVIEQGTHDELLQLDGHYARLVAAQNIEETSDATNQVSDKISEYAEKDLIRQTSLHIPATGEMGLTDAEPQTGTLGYSLIRCIFLMFLEQKSLYVYFFISTMACLVAGATFPAQALIFSRIFVVFTLPPNEGQPKADFYALMFFVIALGNLVAYFIIGITCNIIGQEVTHRYRKELFANMLRQDMDFFNLPGNTSGTLTSRLSTMPTQLQDLISANILLIFVIFINITSTSGLALAYGWKLGLVVVFGGLPPLILSGYIRIRLETVLDAKNSERFAEGANLANEAVMAIKTVSSLTLESSVLQRYQDLMSGIVRNCIRSLLWTIFWHALSQSLEFLVMALGFWYGSKLLSEGEYTSSQFYIIFLGTLFAGQSAALFFSFTTSITQAVEAANYILWLRTCTPVMQENDENRNKGPDADGGGIALSSMSFKYPRRENRVLRDISMTIVPGQFVAFVGPSGCGKSTIVSLLERFYDPTSGQINYAGNSISSYSPRLYRRNISLVQQEPPLYSGSIRENVTLGIEGDATEEEIFKACKQANALEFIDSFPEGLSTPCGNRGLQFSGGQKQRIAIARALIRKPRLLFLDEATSALDTQSERVVQSALDQAKEGRTTIAVAHRLSTIAHANVIFVFGDGRVTEQGTHQELLAKKGRYYDMVLAQSLNKDA